MGSEQVNCKIQLRQDKQGSDLFFEYNGKNYYTRLNHIVTDSKNMRNYHAQEFLKRAVSFSYG